MVAARSAAVARVVAPPLEKRGRLAALGSPSARSSAAGSGRGAR